MLTQCTSESQTHFDPGCEIYVLCRTLAQYISTTYVRLPHQSATSATQGAPFLFLSESSGSLAMLEHSVCGHFIRHTQLLFKTELISHSCGKKNNLLMRQHTPQ